MKTGKNTEKEEKIIENRKVRPGELFVVAGSIGQIGIRTLLAEKPDWFSPWFSASYLERILQEEEPYLFDEEKPLKELVDRFGITGWRAVGEGGILKAVWDFSGEQVNVIFNRDMLMNETEAIANCQASVGILSDETIVGQHPWVDDAQQETERLKKQREEAQKEYEAQQGYDPFAQKEKGGMNEE